MSRGRVGLDQRGAVLAVTAILIVAAIGSLALAIDLGHIYLVKCELRRAADAGALAAAVGLFPVPPGARNPIAATPDCTRGLGACQAVVAANQADGEELQVLSSDVIFGSWDVAANTFTATGCANPRLVNAVKVTVRKDDSANGKVPLFFAGLIPSGLSSMALTAEAVGLSGYAGYVPAGGVFPLAIDANKAPPEHAGENILIDFNPATSDSGCWHTFFDPSTSANDLKKLVNGSTTSPAVRVGDRINVTEGAADSVLQEVQKEFDNRVGNGQDWVVLAPVILSGSHTGTAEVLGFVAFKITLVDAQGTEKRLEGITVPDYVAPGGAPGGPNYGLWGGVPKLVQ